MVSVCHKRRNIRSHRLSGLPHYGLHQRTSFVSIRPHSSAHSGDSSTQRPPLTSWPSIWILVVHLAGIGDVVLVVLALAGQTNTATTLDLFLPTSGDRPWWSDATARACYAMTTTTSNQSYLHNKKFINS